MFLVEKSPIMVLWHLKGVNDTLLIEGVMLFYYIWTHLNGCSLSPAATIDTDSADPPIQCTHLCFDQYQTRIFYLQYIEQ